MRTRMVRLAVLAAALATFMFGIPLAVAAAHLFATDERSELEHTADTIALAVSGDLTRKPANLGSASKPESGMTVVVYSATGVLVNGSGPAQAPAIVRRALVGAATSGHVSGRIAVAVPVSDGDTVIGSVLVTTDPGQVRWRVVKSWLAMGALGGVAIAIVWLVARRQARRLARPLEQLGHVAERLGAGDFSVRGEPVGIAELDAATDSLNSTAQRLGNLVDRERAFSTDASHQLRTPLTSLRIGLEAAIDGSEQERQAAMLDALAATDRLEQTVSDLLTLARGTPTSTQSLDLDALMHAVQERWNGPLAAAGRPLRIVVERPGVAVGLSAQAATHVLDVLLENALHHGTGTVTVTVRDADEAIAIDVADEGPPLTAAAGDLFRNGLPASSGTGIGLPLARRLAEAEGARVLLASADPVRFTCLIPTPRSEYRRTSS